MHGSRGVLLLMQHDDASETVERILDLANRLNASAAEVAGMLSAAAAEEYRMQAGRVIGYMFADFLQPIFREHADLEPESFKRDAPPQPKLSLNSYAAKRIGGVNREVDALIRQLENTTVPGNETRLWNEGIAKIRDATEWIDSFIERNQNNDGQT